MLNDRFWITLATVVFFISGCTERSPDVVKKPIKIVTETNTTKYVPQRVNRKIKLKKVEDDNYSSAYMYPEDKVKKEKVVKAVPLPVKRETSDTPNVETSAVAATGNGMNKTECIAMIGQEKFDKYTQMFGNETSSIKRCAMLKAMN